MQIAILMTNTDESDFAQERPKDGEKWTTLLAPLRPDWEFPVFSVKDGEFPDDVSGFDGIIVTGSPASVHDGEPWIDRLLEMIRQSVSSSVPVFGACFGHQAVSVALGGRVERNPGGWVFGLERTKVNDVLPWMEEGDTELRQHAAHIEQVTALPDGAQIYMGNADCPVGGYAIGKSIFTSQYHPEIDQAFIRDLITELTDQKPADVIENAYASLSQDAENTRFAHWIVSFFEQAVKSEV